MRKFIQNKLKEQKGLTLIELLAVIVILAIIAAIAIPAIGGVIENSRVGAMKSDNLNAIAAAELYALDNPIAADNIITLAMLDGTTAGSEKYLADKGSLTAFSYNFSTKLVTSSANVSSKMFMETIGATKAQISGTANSSRVETGVVRVKKGSAPATN